MFITSMDAVKGSSIQSAAIIINIERQYQYLILFEEKFLWIPYLMQVFILG